MITELLVCGMVGPSIFILVFLVEGILRKNYFPWQHYVSSLALGKRGWIQILNFYICGAAMCAFSIAVLNLDGLGRSRYVSGMLFFMFGMGLIVSGIFPTDAAMGYPEGTKEVFPPIPLSKTGHLHGLAGIAVFGSLPIAAFTMAWHFFNGPNQITWGIYSIFTGLMVPAFFVISGYFQQLALLAVKSNPDSVPKLPVGLFQRLSIITGWTWISILACHLLKVHL